MNADGFKQQIEESKAGFDALRKVIEFSCSSCGLCVSLCPTEAIEMQETVPTLVGNCTQCGFCYQGCPRSFFPLSKVKNRYFGPEHTEVEMRVGRCVERFTSRALADDIFDKGANGGTVTAITCLKKILLMRFCT
jgi:ferredoxin